MYTLLPKIHGSGSAHAHPHERTPKRTRNSTSCSSGESQEGVVGKRGDVGGKGKGKVVKMVERMFGKNGRD